jgi:glycosyltransferase involved in cell wall biosynthesis
MKRPIVLQTYDPEDRYADGLSIISKRVLSTGEPMKDTSTISGAKVLVCGVPFLYEKRISGQNINVIFTTFESDELPSFWVDSINKFYHHCIVPHPEIQSVFRNSGVHIPISVVHQGFTRYKRDGAYGHPGSGCFSIGFLGVPVSRKNFMKLYAACRMLKDNAIPEIKLTVHFSSFYEWMDRHQFDAFKNDLLVDWSSGKYNDDQIAAWYNKLHCYIFPSSGEGWSFTPRESLYLGIPTIISNIPVHRELVDSSYYHVIRNAGREAANFDGQVFGKWAVITEKNISEAILDVYSNYPHCRELASWGARWIETKWANEEVLEMLMVLMRSL